MLLEEAKKLLENEFKIAQNQDVNEYQRQFLEEKIKHSYQVLGAGNYLLCHEAVFNDLFKGRREYLQAIVLLHDIGRFYEIIEGYKGNFVDHGVYGAAFLGKTQSFSSKDCVLAIRHHGHLIEKLYDDDDYKSLSKKEKELVRYVSFLVRDADKLANFYLLSRHFFKVETVFFAKQCFQNPFEKKISENVWKSFLKHQSVHRNDAQNFADMALFFVAWVFDLNYRTSFEFLDKLHVMERLINFFSKFWDKESAFMIKAEIEKFMTLKCLKAD